MQLNMKKILLVCLVALLGVGVCSAQEKKTDGKKTATVVLDADIDCERCAAKIMNNIPLLGKGIKDVKVDAQAKEVTVVYDVSKNDVEHIVKGLASLKVKAEPKTIDGKAVAGEPVS